MPRPTLLIGYGAFGREALQRLLRHSALRGVLKWKKTQLGGIASAERQLRDIALLAVEDRFDADSGARLRNAAMGGEPEFLQDLYRQIKKVPTAAAAAAAESTLTEMIVSTAETLLAQAEQTSDPEQSLPLGLDVVILARPSTPEAIGHLDILVQSGLERLSAFSFLQVGVQGAAKLNCIQLLDFDSYWEASDRAREIRSALRRSIEVWEHRRAERKVAIDRCYLVDGHSRAGHRDANVRLDEVTLFLELLLFEGLRTTQPDLYQQRSSAEPITATFGIRLIEVSTRFLSRNAAATFGHRWLEHLIGASQVLRDRPAENVRAQLAPFHGDELRSIVNDHRLDQAFDQATAELIDAMLKVPDRTAPDWPERARDTFQTELLKLERRLDETTGAMIAELRASRLKHHEKLIADAVDRDLHNERSPVPLESVLREIDEARADLAPQDLERSFDSDVPPDPMARLTAVHERFRTHSAEWLSRQGRGLHWFWPLFSLLLAIGLAPLLGGLLDSVPAPDPTSRAHGLWKASQTINHPLILTSLWFGLIWLFSATAVQSTIGNRIRRAQAFFLNKERGRFSDQIRALVEPLREALLARARENLRSSLANDVAKSLGRIQNHLHERRREMRWLRGQLREFLQLHNRPQISVREWIQREGDFDLMLEANPPTEERFRSRQEDLPEPFKGWNSRYCDAFLDPLKFIDSLSAEYARKFKARLEERSSFEEQEARRKDFRRFLERRDHVLACAFKEDAGVPGSRPYCITSAYWRNLAGVLDELNNHMGIIQDNVLTGRDPARAYLLLLQMGIEPHNLEPTR